MDHWGLSSIAWLFAFLAAFVCCLFAGIRAIEWVASPKGMTRTHPALIFMIVVASYALLSSLFGCWWVEYRLNSLCEQLQNQIRSLPPATKPESISFPTTHRLIFAKASVRPFVDDQLRITFRVEDPRDLFLPSYYVNAYEIRYSRD